MGTTEHPIALAHDGILKLKETIGENKRRAKGFHAITWLAEELDQLKGTEFAVQCGIAHGAFARGSKTFQQIDLLLVLEGNTAEDIAMDVIVEKIISKIYMEVRIFLYLNVWNPETLELALAHPTPLTMRIQKEGIVFYGHNVLLNQGKGNVSRAH